MLTEKEKAESSLEFLSELVEALKTDSMTEEQKTDLIEVLQLSVEELQVEVDEYQITEEGLI